MPEELKLLDEWSERLGLKDWYIILESNVKADDMKADDADGFVVFEETTKSARIQIIDPKSREEAEGTFGASRPFDFEKTLVHELLHLKLCLLERGDDWETKLQLRILHQIIDDLSRALVDAKRSKE